MGEDPEARAHAADAGGAPSDAPAPGGAPDAEDGSELDPAGADGRDEETGAGVPVAHLRGLLEALVFASDRPLKPGELARMSSAPVKQVKALLGDLQRTYADRGFVLVEVAGGWSFRTHVQFAPFVRELAGERPVRLTRAQLETLAIIAYRQPITRPEIDEIRGVDGGATLKLLLERDLARILGKKDEPGRPMLYGTSSHFLEFFGLKSLRDLPTLREFTELTDESRRVAEIELGELDASSHGRATAAAAGADGEAAAPDTRGDDASPEGT